MAPSSPTPLTGDAGAGLADDARRVAGRARRLLTGGASGRPGGFGRRAGRLGIRALAPVTRLGWGVLGVAAACWWLGRTLGWAEAAAAALVLGVLVALSFGLSWAQGRMDASLRLATSGVTAGERASGRLELSRPGWQRLLPATVEVPVGGERAVFHLAAAQAEYTEDFHVTTHRRGIVPVGPARSVAGDPFGLVRRDQVVADVVELCVYPRITPLPSLDAGLIRDLEGRSTNDPSPSDLDFHTVRPYQPADDRRHVHWKATAKSSSLGAETALLVKQYYDTRRSHLGLLVDVDPTHYDAVDDLELAIEVAASMAVRARTDALDVTAALGASVVDGGTVRSVLEGFARVEVGTARMPGLTTSARHLVAVAPHLSLVVFVSGPRTDQDALRIALTLLPPSVRAVVLWVDPLSPPGAVSFPGVDAFTLAALTDLPRLVRGGAL